ncbi:hypothetical protein CFK37_00530 [Virgibacillus phasianinus]|uniref:Competence protein CoiA n=1 Tax=Virgibacillus phasianinus TaxID=2017483 RepID=A0A220TYC0_9BACI|nr:competence protein CoiA family protein [Virgibacillus phasianinus]ASK60797.1 hypothetical protein CFK37_00530 [Virgibacillus phasianinus]
MLQAKLKNGKLITLASLPKQEIIKAKQDEFFCPTCEEPVLVKAGMTMIPHFAHRQRLECASNDYGEGPYHEQGKLVLYNWLRMQQVDVRLEPYIQEIGQRPDLYAELRNRKIAIEYQCARIPIELLSQRNEGYKGMGITPIWILGAKHFQRIRKYHFKIDQFLLSFIHKFSAEFPSTLYFFCPQTLYFIIVQHIHVLSPRYAMGLFRFIPIRDLKFPNIFFQQNRNDTWLYHQWNQEKKAFRLRPAKNKYGSERTWHQWLYKKGAHKETLPSIVYLPIQSQYLMKTPLWNWQSRLCLELLLPLPIGAVFSLDRCYRILHYQPQHHLFSLIRGMDNPVHNYLMLLKKLGIIEELDTNIFQKVQDIHLHKNIEASLEGDARIMNQLLHCSTIG